jgi:hypothetical protein
MRDKCDDYQISEEKQGIDVVRLHDIDPVAVRLSLL